MSWLFSLRYLSQNWNHTYSNSLLFFIWNLVVTQDYDTDLLKAFVIKGNEALLKCEIPSFVADFVTVESWVDNEGNQYFSGTTNNYGNPSNMKYVFFTKKDGVR